MKKIILNGYGRIGRLFTQFYHDDRNRQFELVAINDLQQYDVCQHLAHYDSIYGRQDINLDNFIWSHSPCLKELLSTDQGAIVLEATGAFTNQYKAQEHLENGAGKVIVSAPGKGERFKTVCYGINHTEITPADSLISAASCTTGALAPIVKAFSTNFQLQSLMFTTVHAATNDQRVQDSGHKDLRRARSVFGNLIPTATGGSKAIKALFPHIDIPIHGMAIRTPHAAVSLLDITLHLNQEVGREDVINALQKESQSSLKGLLRLEEKPLVSSDYIKELSSVVIDLDTLYVGKSDVKFVGWYDNEYGYAHKLYQLAKHVASMSDS